MGGFGKGEGYSNGFRKYGDSGLFYKQKDGGDEYRAGDPLYSAGNDESELVTKGSLASKEPQAPTTEKINPKTQQSIKPISDSVVTARNDQKRRAATPTGSVLTDQGIIGGGGSKTLLGQ